MTRPELDAEIAALQRFVDRYPGEPTTPTEFPDFFGALWTLNRYKRQRDAMPEEAA